MLTEVIDAGFTNLDCVNDNEVEVGTASGHCNVILVIDGAKVTQTTVDTLQFSFPLSLFQLRSYSVAICHLTFCLAHMVDLLSDLTDLLFDHLILLSQIDLSLAFGICLLPDRHKLLLVVVEFILGLLQLLLVGAYLAVALFVLAHYFISALLNALNLGPLTLNVCLDLSHLVVKLV